MVLTNADDLIYDLAVHPPHPLIQSDHLSLPFVCGGTQLHQYHVIKLSMYLTSLKQITMVFCNFYFDFTDCFQSNSFEHVQSYIKDTIVYGMQLYIPTVKLRKQERLPKKVQFGHKTLPELPSYSQKKVSISSHSSCTLQN